MLVLLVLVLVLLVLVLLLLLLLLLYRAASQPASIFVRSAVRSIGVSGQITSMSLIASSFIGVAAAAAMQASAAVGPEATIEKSEWVKIDFATAATSLLSSSHVLAPSAQYMLSSMLLRSVKLWSVSSDWSSR